MHPMGRGNMSGWTLAGKHTGRQSGEDRSGTANYHQCCRGSKRIFHGSLLSNVRDSFGFNFIYYSR
jgi:hypothetical protein